MKQTRHSFATNALSCGENPLWIAEGYGAIADTDMIIKAYGKFIENASGLNDGSHLNSIYSGLIEEDRVTKVSIIFWQNFGKNRQKIKRGYTPQNYNPFDIIWYARQDSNLRPTDSKSGALSS